MTHTAISPTAAAVHAAAIVIDAHADIEVPGRESRFVGDDGQSRVAPHKMRAGGVDAVVMAVAVGPGAPRSTRSGAATSFASWKRPAPEL